MSPDIVAKRDLLPPANRVTASGPSHAGLVLARYLGAHPGESSQQRGAEKRELLMSAQNAQRAARELYNEAFRRRGDWLKAMGTKQFDLPVESRLIIGLGGASTLETGLTLHQTYGVPIIPGSALKGLAARYCDRAFGELAGQQELRRRVEFEEDGHKKTRTGEQYRALFGDTDDAGYIVFHDGWIAPESLTKDGEGLLLDVMTPHHGDYYGGHRYRVGHPLVDELIPPTDFDSPVPIQFLSVRGTFHLALSSDAPPETVGPWLEWAKELLTTALGDWGVGGKTSSGYGRLIPVDVPATAARRTAALPAAKDLVEAELTERREKKGGGRTWWAKHFASGVSGPIQNSEALPDDVQAGQRLLLYVAYAKTNEIAFKYPTDEVKQQVEKSNSKQHNTGRRRQ